MSQGDGALFCNLLLVLLKQDVRVCLCFIDSSLSHVIVPTCQHQEAERLTTSAKLVDMTFDPLKLLLNMDVIGFGSFLVYMIAFLAGVEYNLKATP